MFTSKSMLVNIISLRTLTVWLMRTKNNKMITFIFHFSFYIRNCFFDMLPVALTCFVPLALRII